MYTIGAKRKKTTVIDGGVKGIEMGQIAQAGEYRWKMVQEITEDSRQEPHFETTFKANMFHTDATEVDVFWALMPLSRDSLLNIIRDNADVDGDMRLWEKWHVDAALAVIFGGAQFKEGTNLWSTKRVGMIPAPD